MIELSTAQETALKTKDCADAMYERLANVILGEKFPIDVTDSVSGEVIIPAYRKINKTLIRKCISNWRTIDIDPSPIRNFFLRAFLEVTEKFAK